MAYQPHDWSNNRPPGISAQRLREMDEGIKDAHDLIESRSGTSEIQPTTTPGVLRVVPKGQ